MSETFAPGGVVSIEPVTEIRGQSWARNRVVRNVALRLFRQREGSEIVVPLDQLLDLGHRFFSRPPCPGVPVPEPGGGETDGDQSSRGWNRERRTSKRARDGESSGFQAVTRRLQIGEILNKAPTSPSRVNPELPPELESIISNALEKDPKLRYQSAGDFRADLERLRRDAGQARSLVSNVPSGPRAATLDTASSDSQIAIGLVHRHKLVAAAGLVVVAVVVGLGIWFGGSLGTPALAQEDENARRRLRQYHR